MEEKCSRELAVHVKVEPVEETNRVIQEVTSSSEHIIKTEPPWPAWAVAAVMEERGGGGGGGEGAVGLYADHVVKGELVLGPERLHRPRPGGALLVSLIQEVTSSSEHIIKTEPPWPAWAVAAVVEERGGGGGGGEGAAGLYADHVVKGELVLGPERLHRPRPRPRSKKIFEAEEARHLTSTGYCRSSTTVKTTPCRSLCIRPAVSLPETYTFDLNYQLVSRQCVAATMWPATSASIFSNTMQYTETQPYAIHGNIAKHF